MKLARDQPGWAGGRNLSSDLPEGLQQEEALRSQRARQAVHHHVQPGVHEGHRAVLQPRDHQATTEVGGNTWYSAGRRKMTVMFHCVFT